MRDMIPALCYPCLLIDPNLALTDPYLEIETNKTPTTEEDFGKLNA